MNKETIGNVLTVKKQWWLKINIKPIRFGPLDGAIFPHVIKVGYTVNNKAYVKRKWIKAGLDVPDVGSFVTISYCENKPKKAKILLQKI